MYALLSPRSEKRRLYAIAISFCLSVRLFVRLSVAWEICEVIRYVAAPGRHVGAYHIDPRVLSLLYKNQRLCQKLDWFNSPVWYRVDNGISTVVPPAATDVTYSPLTAGGCRLLTTSILTAIDKNTQTVLYSVHGCHSCLSKTENKPDEKLISNWDRRALRPYAGKFLLCSTCTTPWL